MLLTLFKTSSECVVTNFIETLFAQMIPKLNFISDKYDFYFNMYFIFVIKYPTFAKFIKTTNM